MTKRLDSTAGTVSYDNLLFAIDIPVKQKPVTVISGAGVLAKGTALAMDAAGKMSILGTTKTAGYYKVLATIPGAIKVVASGAVTGEINLASVTPVIGTYTPVAGDYVLYQAADKLEANCILAEDVDATSADTQAMAFIKGHFNKQKLVVKSAYTMTDADVEAFRAKGIILSNSFSV